MTLSQSCFPNLRGHRPALFFYDPSGAFVVQLALSPFNFWLALQTYLLTSSYN